MAGIKPITEKPIADEIKSDSYVVVIQKGADNQYKVHRVSAGKLVSADNVVLKSADKPDVDTSKLIYSIAGVQSFLYKNTVLSTIDQSASEVANWTDAKKAQVRKNIDVNGGKYELIDEITTTEETAYSGFTLSSVTKDGVTKAYKFDAAFIKVTIPATTAASAVYMNMSAAGGMWFGAYVKSQATKTNSAVTLWLETYKRYGMWHNQQSVGNSYDTAAGVLTTQNNQETYVEKIRVYSPTESFVFPVGTKIQIYGVWAQ